VKGLVLGLFGEPIPHIEICFNDTKDISTAIDTMVFDASHINKRRLLAEIFDLVGNAADLLT
jgi:hypothetical protein